MELYANILEVRTYGINCASVRMTVPTPAVRLNKRGVTQMIQPKFLRRIRLAAVIAAVSIVTPANVSTPASAATPTVNWIK